MRKWYEVDVLWGGGGGHISPDMSLFTLTEVIRGTLNSCYQSSLLGTGLLSS